MKTIKAKVHMLPTEEAENCIIQFINRREMYYQDKILNQKYLEFAEKKSYHLYITNDETPNFKHPRYKVNGNRLEVWDADDMECLDLVSIEIIATTDPNISKIGYQSGKLYGVPSIEGTKFEDTRLPVIPQDFIKAYCEQGGIEEVLVEHKEYIKCTNCNLTEEDCECNVSYTQDLIGIDRVKLNPDNTIIIHPVEEKMYSREELTSFAKYAIKNGFGLNHTESLFDKWVEENL